MNHQGQSDERSRRQGTLERHKDRAKEIARGRGDHEGRGHSEGRGQSDSRTPDHVQAARDRREI
jgi:hypothetical protein